MSLEHLPQAAKEICFLFLIIVPACVMIVHGVRVWRDQIRWQRIHRRIIRQQAVIDALNKEGR